MTTEDHTMSRKQKDTEAPASDETDAGDSTILIDYRGTVGNADRQAEVEHQRSPLVMFYPEPGVDSFSLQPGLNRIADKVFRFYADKHPQFVGLLASGHVTKLDALPRDARSMLDLVGRTIDRDALAWIAEQENARSMPRQNVLDAITRRASVGTPVKIKPWSYRPIVPMQQRLKGDTSTGAAMG